jgi:uncharacterized membrane protein YhiD involved in acid resistance
MDADQIKNLFGLTGDSVFTIGDILLSMGASAFLSLILSWTYTKTHSGPNFSRTFLISLFVMSVATSVVMLIIGSNIARAFSLVGALSIIRFRTAVKDPRDTAFLFAGIVAGMGCGTGFYLPALLLTLFLCVCLLLVDHFKLGQKENLSTIIKITTEKTFDAGKIEVPLKKHFGSFSRINRIEDYAGKSLTLVYSAMPNRQTDLSNLENELAGVPGVLSASYYQADQHAPF